MEHTPEQQEDMKRSAAAGVLRAAGRALFPGSAPPPPPSSSTAAAAFVSSAPGASPPPPKTGDHAPPEARMTPDPEDAWRKERRIGRGVGDEPPRGKGSRLGPYHLGTEEEEEKDEQGEEENEPVTPERRKQRQRQQEETPAAAAAAAGRRLSLRSLSLSSPESPHGEVAARGADPSTLDDARASSAPGTPYGARGHRDQPDLDFFGSQGGEGEGEGEGGGEESDAPRRASASSSSASSSFSSTPETALGQRSEETIWDRLRGPHASEANAASAEAVAEGKARAGARAKEEAEIAPKLGGGTGKAL